MCYRSVTEDKLKICLAGGSVLGRSWEPGLLVQISDLTAVLRAVAQD